MSTRDICTLFLIRSDLEDRDILWDRISPGHKPYYVSNQDKIVGYSSSLGMQIR